MKYLNFSSTLHFSLYFVGRGRQTVLCLKLESTLKSRWVVDMQRASYWTSKRRGRRATQKRRSYVSFQWDQIQLSVSNNLLNE